MLTCTDGVFKSGHGAQSGRSSFSCLMEEVTLAIPTIIIGVLTFMVVVVAIAIGRRAISQKDGDAMNARIADIMTTAAQCVSEAGAFATSILQ